MAASKKQIKVGKEIPLVTKKAFQRTLQEQTFLADSIHNDEYTRKKGYPGALVSGYVLSAYMSEMLVNFFGPDWLRGGKLSLKFFKPGVQAGDTVTCRGVVTDRIVQGASVQLSLDIWMEKGQGIKVALGKASGVVRA